MTVEFDPAEEWGTETLRRKFSRMAKKLDQNGGPANSGVLYTVAFVHYYEELEERGRNPDAILDDIGVSVQDWDT